MQTAIQIQTTVLPGHRIEVTAPELPEGSKATVYVVLENGSPTKRRLSEVIGDNQGGARPWPSWS